MFLINNDWLKSNWTDKIKVHDTNRKTQKIQMQNHLVILTWLAMNSKMFSSTFFSIVTFTLIMTYVTFVQCADLGLPRSVNVRAGPNDPDLGALVQAQADRLDSLESLVQTLQNTVTSLQQQVGPAGIIIFFRLLFF